MISGIARLRAKKGFTIIELIVVIAIIGILTSIIVAAMSYDTKPTKGKGVAKDFYYVAQDVYSVSKIANPSAIATGTRTGFFAELNNVGQVTNRGTFQINSAASGAINMDMTQITGDVKPAHNGTAADDVLCLQARMFAALERYLNTMDNMSGTIFVVADDKFRVQAAYWTDSGYVLSGNVSLVDNNMMANGHYCCAYPAYLSTAGQSMFVIS